MANLPAEGKIIKVYANAWYPVLYDIELNNEVDPVFISYGITPIAFDGIGKRFWVKSEWQAERKQKREALEKRMASLGIKVQ